MMSNVHLLDIPEGDLHWLLKYFKNACEYNPARDVLESPIFKVKHRGECCDWRLNLYPKGDSEENVNDLLIYLKMCGFGSSLIRAECVCTIICSTEKRIISSCINNFTQVGERFHCVKIKTMDLLKNLQEQDLNIVVRVRVWFSENIVNELLIASQVESHQETDVIIKVGDNTFNVHKNVLIRQSPVFAAMFRHNTRESKENYIEIADIDYLVVEQIISFMYKGNVKNLDTLAKELLCSAEKYAIVSLKNICENYYIKIMTVDNVIDILNIADRYCALKLKEKAMHFLVLHIKDLIDTEGYKLIARSQPIILDQIIRLTILLNASNIREKLIFPCLVTVASKLMKGSMSINTINAEQLIFHCIT